MTDNNALTKEKKEELSLRIRNDIFLIMILLEMDYYAITRSYQFSIFVESKLKRFSLLLSKHTETVFIIYDSNNILSNNGFIQTLNPNPFITNLFYRSSSRIDKSNYIIYNWWWSF